MKSLTERLPVRVKRMRSVFSSALITVLALILVIVGTLNSLAEEGQGSSWLDSGGTATVEDLSGGDDTDENGEPERVIALYRTNILQAEDGVGTARYTLAVSTDTPLDETDPTLAAMATLTRRLIQLDGSLGDPSDASPLSDVEATKDIDSADVFAVLVGDRSIFIYKNGEQVVGEEMSGHYTKITYTRNKKAQPALRYCRANGVTVLYTFTPGSVVLFTGDYLNLSIDYALKGVPIVLGAGCRIEELHVNSKILLHNSGLVEDSDYPPDGVELMGIAVDEDQNPILIDSGMWSTGPRRVRGRWCTVCRKEYNGKISDQLDLHLVHVCIWDDCKFGGLWASCAPEDSLYNPAKHGPAPWCPYGICAACSNIRCQFCQQDIAAGKASAANP
ncbi:hypothetical protein FACS1894184_20160 [Clostridia bacterium]|nr:hypothetical protein FACS1894184_20160 [Clostridia bacterium]